MKEIEFQKRVIELLESIAGACARAESWAPHVPDELPSPFKDPPAWDETAAPSANPAVIAPAFDSVDMGDAGRVEVKRGKRRGKRA